MGVSSATVGTLFALMGAGGVVGALDDAEANLPAPTLADLADGEPGVRVARLLRVPRGRG